MKSIYTITHPIAGKVRWYTQAEVSGAPIEFLDDFVEKNIIEVFIPQLKGLRHGLISNPRDIYDGKIRFFKDVVDQLITAFAEIERQGFKFRLLSFHGAFNQRLVKKKNGGPAYTPSNHAFGTAFDINADYNIHGNTPAAIGEVGSVLELVPIFEKYGITWGGLFSVPDGMHFEVSKIL